MQVPLGTREVVGVVWGLRAGAGRQFQDGHRRHRRAEPARPRCASSWTGSPGTPLRPRARRWPWDSSSSDTERPEVVRVGVKLAGPMPKRMTPARQRVIEAAQDGLVRLKRELAHAAGVSAGVIDGLIDEGTLETVALLQEPVAEVPNPDFGTAAPVGRAARGRRGAHRVHGRGASARHPARRRHRIWQDGGLFRGGGRGRAAGPAGADSHARDRPHGAVSRPIRRPLRREARHLAFGRHGPQARAPLRGHRLRAR